MIKLAEDRNCECIALVTAMDRPLGRACGNALEIEEVIAAQRRRATRSHVAHVRAGCRDARARRRRDRPRCRASRIGEGHRHRARGGDVSADHRGAGRKPVGGGRPAAATGGRMRDLHAPRRGLVANVEPRAIGRGLTRLGGGRTRVDDGIDPTVGFVITARPGDWVAAATSLATISRAIGPASTPGRETLGGAIVIADEAEPPLPPISHRVTTAGVELYRSG